MPLSFRPLAPADLPAIERWFDDPETTRWLGDRDWPRRLVGLATEPDRHALVGLSGDEPVALLDVERYEDATASVAIVVSPEVRRQGIGTAVLASIFTHAELTGTELVFGEVEQGNAGAERLVCAAGFALDNEGARTEGFSRWALRRPA